MHESPEPREIVLLSQARLALAQAKSLDEIKEIRDQAECMRQYIRQRDDSLEAQNLAAELKLRAERRAGQMLKEMPKNTGSKNIGSRRSHDATAEIPTLDEIGINKTQSARWQQVAALPEEDFERYIARTKDAEKELTTSGVLRLSRDLERAERGEAGPDPEPAADFDEDAQWAQDEKHLRSRYQAWPEDQRGYFVLKVLGFANRLRCMNHPDIEFVVGAPLAIKEVDR